MEVKCRPPAVDDGLLPTKVFVDVVVTCDNTFFLFCQIPGTIFMAERVSALFVISSSSMLLTFLTRFREPASMPPNWAPAFSQTHAHIG